MNDEIEIVGEISAVETIASGSAVKRRRLLSKAYGAGKVKRFLRQQP